MATTSASPKEGQIIVYRLELEADGSLSKEKQYNRLPPPVKPYLLRFNVRAGSPASHGGILYTNYPIDDGGEFDRHKFHSKNFPVNFSRPLYVDIVIRLPGTFEFYVEHRAVSTLPGEVLTDTNRSVTCYFTVDPVLEIIPRRRMLSSELVSSASSVPLPLDGLVIESVLPKLLGPMSRWEPHFKYISELGYNMVHFVPVQVRGESNSPYSIFDQLLFSDDLFDEQDRGKGPEEKTQLIRETLEKIEQEYGILSLTDVVWNHTASNSRWLQEHPEAAYNLVNSPHLTPAYELETALLKYSENLGQFGLPTYLRSEGDLTRIIEGIKTHVLPEIRLWEYYVINAEDTVKQVRDALENGTEVDESLFKDVDINSLDFKQQVEILSKRAVYGREQFGKRFSKMLNIDRVLAFIKKWSKSEECNSIIKAEHEKKRQESENVRLAKIEERRLEREKARLEREKVKREQVERSTQEEDRIEQEKQERARKEQEMIDRARKEQQRIRDALKRGAKSGNVNLVKELPRERKNDGGFGVQQVEEIPEAASSSIDVKESPGANVESLGGLTILPSKKSNVEGKITKNVNSDGVEKKSSKQNPVHTDEEKPDKVDNSDAEESSDDEPGEPPDEPSDEPPDEPPEPPVEVPPIDPLPFYLEKLKALINEINLPYYKNHDNDVVAILENIWNRVKYTHLDGNGPRAGEITKKHPLIETYFTRIPLNEVTRKHPEGSLAVANNGWIWNANPLLDFASSGSFAYLRREVIVWGDCVKLRYGESRNDSPWLWDHMTKYTELLASLFHGFRIDNCHSTPIHLAKYLLDKARRIRPNLYVVAELFTGSEEVDIRFVSQLGIGSLIREAMQPWDARELSRYVFLHGGKPIGSMDTECVTDKSTCLDPDDQKKEVPCLVIPLSGSKPHALFMDCTHDNETPHQKRTAEDTLSTGALVAVSSCAVGSVRGYDEIFPNLVDLVNETRLYPTYEEPLDVGISRVKKVLLHLHTEMALDGYIETHVHHENEYIFVHRFHPNTLDGYLLIARCAFVGPTMLRGDFNPISLRGTSAELLFSAYLDIYSRTVNADGKYLAGLPGALKSLSAPTMEKRTDVNGEFTEILVPKDFPSGSVMLMRTWIDNKPDGFDDFVETGTEEAFAELDLVDLNIVLYRCHGEEEDVTPGNGVYNVPGYGNVPYCGIEGLMSVLRPIMKNNDLGHPFCTNLREGHWALDYTVDRLKRHLFIAPKLQKLIDWYESRFKAVKTVPSFLVPKYFALTIKTAYKAAVKRALEQLSPFAYEGGIFIKSLALVSVQMYGTVLSTGLHPKSTVQGPSMAAGLPHFTFRHMRCWGRDVFISLRGLFLTIGNFEAARRHILCFGSVLKHGMIPNLLDACRRPRYNCRDASWWYLQAIQDYCNFAPEGVEFLKQSVKRRFPQNDEFVEWDDPKSYAYESTILEIIQEIMERHARGIHFREWNAGPNLDHAMTNEGFQVDIHVDWNTGLLFGGNQWNCGTWMDKMGESEKAGNKGEPATPRDGAAVEIIGLLKSTLRWLSKLNNDGVYPWNGVQIQLDGGSSKLITYAEWNNLIQNSFEKHFYIPTDPQKDSEYELTSFMVRRRGIYKDTYQSSRKYTDYQLRPNFPIAMVVAPELFNEEHAMTALNTARAIIAGPLGMRTLDPEDSAYRGDYDNGNDSHGKLVAKGWNYHQGPEWLWVTGYFLRAYLYYDTRIGAGKGNAHETIHNITRILLPHRKMIEDSPWAGLPELTNANGAKCRDSCPTQAWSAATLLDLFDDIKKLGGITIQE